MKNHTYEITEDGRVFSVSANWRGHGTHEMTQKACKDGYPTVQVYLEGKRKRVFVHRLVAYKFLGEKPSSAHQVCHIDGNKNNNHVSNLRWGTSKENCNDRHRHGRTSNGQKHAFLIRLKTAAPELLETLISALPYLSLSNPLYLKTKKLIDKIEGKRELKEIRNNQIELDFLSTAVFSHLDERDSA